MTRDEVQTHDLLNTWRCEMLIQTYNGMGEPAEIYNGTVITCHEHPDGVWATISIRTDDDRSVPNLFARLAEIRGEKLAAE